jgi:predicted transcriptional regulator
VSDKAVPSEAELEVLRYVTEHPGTSVRDVAAEFARTRGLARTTVLTLMERLRKKGHLTRRKAEGVFQYSARESRGELLSRLVGRFVEKTLGGSLQPFVAYLLDRPRVSREELDELKDLVDKLDTKDRKKEEPR